MTEELLQGLAFLVVVRGDRRGVLASQGGQQAGDVVAGVVALLAALQVLGEGLEELLPAGQQAAEQGRVQFGIGQQFVQPEFKASLHRQLFSKGPFL